MSKVTTKTEVRLSFVNLITPRKQNEESESETYSTAILIPKSDVDTVASVSAAIKEALAEGVSKKWGGKTPGNLKNPMRDGDAERPDDDTYKGMMFLNAKGPRGGQEKPILLDKNGRETDSQAIIFSGVYARVSLQFYPFDRNGNRGVAAGVSSVLSGEHGEPLGSVVTADSARSEFGVSTPASSARDEFTAPAKNIADSTSNAEDDPWAS
jgi:hypothetical protein